MADENPITLPKAALAAVTVEDTPYPPAPPPAAVTQAVVSVTEKQTPLLSQPSLPLESSTTNVEEVVAPEKQNPVAESKKIPQSMVSFKEESNEVKDLLEIQKRALDELKQLTLQAIDNQEFTYTAAKPPPPTATEEPPPPASTETPATVSQIVNEATPTAATSTEISIWGIPLFKDEKSDVILLKFLRARDFKVKDAFIMLKSTIRWRKEFAIDALVDEDLGDDLEKVVFMHGFDKQGHPVCYNVYGEFQNEELYQKTFSDGEKGANFLRWRIQFLERSIRKLDFRPGGISTIFQVSDLKNSPGPGKRELRLATRQALVLLQDNYPEFVAKQVFVNVPWWYFAFYSMISPFMTQRTKGKFVFASPARTPGTLFKYIAPEHVLIQYGGLSVDYCDCNPEFSIDDPAGEVTVQPATKQTVEIVVNEQCIIVWELRVVGWEVRYSAEFVPNQESGYTIIVQKKRKMTSTDEPAVRNSFKIIELGKILITVDNPTSKKKKLLYRYKVLPFC